MGQKLLDGTSWPRGAKWCPSPGSPVGTCIACRAHVWMKGRLSLAALTECKQSAACSMRLWRWSCLTACLTAELKLCLLVWRCQKR